MATKNKVVLASVIMFLLVGCSNVRSGLEPRLSANQILDRDSQGNPVVVSESRTTRAMFMRAPLSDYKLKSTDNVFVLKFAIINKSDSELEVSPDDVWLDYGSRISKPLDSSGFLTVQNESLERNSNLYLLGALAAATAVATDETGSMYALANQYVTSGADSLEKKFTESDEGYDKFSDDYFTGCTLSPHEGCSGLLAFKVEESHPVLTVIVNSSAVGNHAVVYE